MTIGMMWYFSKTENLVTNIGIAAEHYRAKYKVTPNVCHTNPKMIEETEEVSGIRIVPDSDIMPFHLWLGVSE